MLTRFLEYSLKEQLFSKGSRLLLAVSGLMLYYPPAEDWRDAGSLVHQVVGGLLIFILPLHVVLGRRRRLASADF